MKIQTIILALLLALPAAAGNAQTSSILYLKPTKSKIQLIGNYKAPKPAPVADSKNGEISRSAVSPDIAGPPMAAEPARPVEAKTMQAVVSEKLPTAARLAMPELRLGEAALPVVQTSATSSQKR